MSTIHKGDRALHLPGGVEINAQALAALGRPPQNDPMQSCVAPFSAAADGDAAEEELEPWVDQVMARYADPIDAQKLEQASLHPSLL